MGGEINFLMKMLAIGRTVAMGGWWCERASRLYNNQPAQISRLTDKAIKPASLPIPFACWFCQSQD